MIFAGIAAKLPAERPNWSYAQHRVGVGKRKDVRRERSRRRNAGNLTRFPRRTHVFADVGV